HTFRRYIINFGDLSELEARRWPDLMAVIEARVKPSRLQAKREPYRSRWWQFAEKQLAAYQAIKGLGRILANSEVSPHLAFAFLPPTCISAPTLYIYPLATYAAFCALQSRSHELWARFFSSSMKDDLRYSPSDCLETFPFPEGFETHPQLEAAGKE